MPAERKQYIEAVGSGSCAFEESYFYLNVTDPPGGYVEITQDAGAEYTDCADPEGSFALTITPPSDESDQASITIVLLGSSA